MRLHFAILAFSFSLVAPLHGQTTASAPISLVMLDGEGRMLLPYDVLYPPTHYRLEDGNYRTTIVFENHRDDIAFEASVFPNDDNSPEACRDMTMMPLLADLRTRATITGIQKSTRRSGSGNALALTSFTLSSSGGVNPGFQQNFYAFAAGPHICAEIHVIKPGYVLADAPVIDALLNHLDLEPTYQPTAQDYSVLAGAFFETKQDYRPAALFYRRAIDVLPNASDTRSLRRSLTDQLSISYAVYGDVIESYHVNESAIDVDPTYPFYYYNLACVDAELHNPLDARRHLEEAYDRRSNANPGETLPNPSQDASLLKLRSDHKFWSYVKTISGVSE